MFTFKNNVEKTKFKELKIGDMFVTDEDPVFLYIKIASTGAVIINSISKTNNHEIGMVHDFVYSEDAIQVEFDGIVSVKRKD